MDEVTKPTNVIAAIHAVMRDLPGIGKGERSQQGYNYRGIEQITAEAQPLFARYGVMFAPRVVSHESREITVNGKPWTEDHLAVEYDIYGPGGVEDKITIGPIHSLGRDNSDKGCNKAMTQAFKYALIQTLCIGDGKDDADAEPAHEVDQHTQKVRGYDYNPPVGGGRAIPPDSRKRPAPQVVEISPKARLVRACNQDTALASQLWEEATDGGKTLLNPTELQLLLSRAEALAAAKPS